MAFIRCRQSNRAKSYQLVETYRKNGKIKQRVLAVLLHEQVKAVTDGDLGRGEAIQAIDAVADDLPEFLDRRRDT